MSGDGGVFFARWKSLWQCCLPPLHRTQRWVTPRFGLGGKEPCAEILRWESPALPETPLPQDDYGDRIVMARLKSYPSQDHRVGGTLIPGRSCGTQGPSTALRSGRDDRVVSLFGDGRVFARWKLLWQCRLPPLHRTQRWGTPRFGLGGKEPGAEILRWESPALPEAPLPQDDVNFPTLLFCSSSGDCAEHKVPPLRFTSVWMTELFRDVRAAEFVSARCKALWQRCLPPLHRTQRWGTLCLNSGNKKPRPCFYLLILGGGT